MTQLMVIEGKQLVVEGADEPELERLEPEINEYDREALSELAEEIEFLEETVENDRERMVQFIKKVDDELVEENAEIRRLSQLLLKEHEALSNSEDLEDQLTAEHTRKALEDDFEIDVGDEDNDAPNRHANVEEEEELELDDRIEQVNRLAEYTNRKKLLKHLFKLITIKTHPDKCGTTSKLNHYHAACKARDDENLHGMQAIYKKVYGHEYGKSSLFDRLNAARRRRDQLRSELNDIRSTGAWQIYQISVETDFPRAINIVRENLRMQIQGMRVMLSQLQEKRNWM